MIDAERLLSGLLKSGMAGRLGRGLNPANMAQKIGRQTGLSGSGGAALGMGLLGVAMAAFEHFTNSSNQPQPPSSTAGGPPPAPAPSNGNFSIPSAPPPPPPGSVAVNQIDANEARLLIQGMIAAAAADGVIDEEERGRIIGRLESENIGDDERHFLADEMQAPASIAELASHCRDKGQAIRLYVAALLAIKVDTEAERLWLGDLAAALGLSADELNEIHQA